jgi:hypothetical protein
MNLALPREIAVIEVQIQAGHPDVAGLCFAHSDWSTELNIVEEETWYEAGYRN